VAETRPSAAQKTVGSACIINCCRLPSRCLSMTAGPIVAASTLRTSTTTSTTIAVVATMTTKIHRSSTYTTVARRSVTTEAVAWRTHQAVRVSSSSDGGSDKQCSFFSCEPVLFSSPSCCTHKNYMF